MTSQQTIRFVFCQIKFESVFHSLIELVKCSKGEFLVSH